MTLVASIGLTVNVICALLLRPTAHAGLGLRAAFMHVMADLLGSVAAIAAGIVLLLTGWYAVDAIIAVAIAVLVLIGASKEAVHRSRQFFFGYLSIPVGIAL
jgi:cobalt-zinc-cadmium efflux system protein